jgi:nucleoside-diphosphate-sugar epimerase
MRVFVAGASGVIGVRLVPLLVAAGHEVAAMTRSSEKAAGLERLGAAPMVCDVFDIDALHESVAGFGPTAVIHELTDLPDDPTMIPEFGATNLRIRREGTENLVAAARAVGVAHLLAQSIAWKLSAKGHESIDFLEKTVLDAGGVVLRYGQWYGPDTYFETDQPPPPRIHIDAAAARTVALLGAAPGVYLLTED